MTVLVVILVILALAFGVGAVLEGIAWLLLISLVAIVVAVWLGWRKLQGFLGRRQ